MAKQTLSEGLVYKGRIYGPGEVELPDDDDLKKRVAELEDEAGARTRQMAAAGLEMLPSGHPYRQMLAVVSNQPAPPEQEPEPKAMAQRKVGDINNTANKPDGFSVSGTGAEDENMHKPGLQVATVSEPAQTPHGHAPAPTAQSVAPTPEGGAQNQPKAGESAKK